MRGCGPQHLQAWQPIAECRWRPGCLLECSGRLQRRARADRTACPLSWQRYRSGISDLRNEIECLEFIPVNCSDSRVVAIDAAELFTDPDHSLSALLYTNFCGTRREFFPCDYGADVLSRLLFHNSVNPARLQGLRIDGEFVRC